ncbi:hypothetical protein D3C75_726480 [compost metagenome]
MNLGSQLLHRPGQQAGIRKAVILDQIGGSFQMNGLLGIMEILMTGKNDDLRRAFPAFFNFTEHLQPVHSRHRDIGYD